ncbi:MAG: aspartate kinase [candidate division KSB1 bacterium]|nr:aspartate kinase [candidate division KSB1 bacterium]
MKVLKFGGTSVGDREAIEQVVAIIRREAADAPVMAVFSAMGDTTDRLVEIARLAVRQRLDAALQWLGQLRRRHFGMARALITGDERYQMLRDTLAMYFARLEQMARSLSVLQDLSPRVQDEFLAHGELLSTRLLQAVLAERGLPAVWLDSRRIIKTDATHTEAVPDMAASREAVAAQVRPLLEQGQIPVLQGFIGADAEGHTTTLGRGGSDYTAALLGSLLPADEVQIWTDVDGILTADPTLVPDARLVERLSYREAAELAYFGARVLHPKTLAPAMERHIPVWVRNIARPDGRGTCILFETGPTGAPVKSIAYKKGITLITIVATRGWKPHDFLRRVFDVFDRYQTAVDLVSTTEVSVALAIHRMPHRERFVEELQQLGRVEWQADKAIVCVVGERLRGRSGIAGEILAAAAPHPVSMISLGGSEINISFVCDEQALPAVIPQLHRRFFAKRPDRRNGKAAKSPAKRDEHHQLAIREASR